MARWCESVICTEGIGHWGFDIHSLSNLEHCLCQLVRLSIFRSFPFGCENLATKSWEGVIIVRSCHMLHDTAATILRWIEKELLQVVLEDELTLVSSHFECLG